jgi:geranylgeranyl diphosphate synthase, type I
VHDEGQDDGQTDFLAALEHHLQTWVSDTVVERVRAIDEDLSVFAELCLSAVSAGGKRLRPRFAYWAWRLGAGDDQESGPIVQLAGSLELLHAAILVHDDVIDGSELRRGQPSVRAALAAHHRAAGWWGDSQEFGDHTALLVGDLLWSAAHDAFDDGVADLPPERRSSVLRCFRSMRSEVLSGQLLELRAQAARDLNAGTAQKILRYKTSAYTVEWPAEIGLESACSAPAVVVETLNRFARAVGQAFQLRDDLSDLFGSTLTSGKRAGDDLRAGKPTELMGAALELAAEADVQTLSRIIGDATANDADVAEVQRIVEQTGALGRVRDRIDALVTTAEEAIVDLSPVDDAVRAGLSELVAECTELSFLDAAG